MKNSLHTILFLLTIIAVPGMLQAQTAGHSVLADGYWVKVRIFHTGIYKLTYDDLRKMGLPDPSHPHIYGNGGGMLPEMNNVPVADDLQEIPVWMDKGDDGVFGKGDHLLFYATGPLRWKYSFTDSFYTPVPHLYDRYAYYFITSASVSPPEIVETTPPADPVNYVSTAYDAVGYHEVNKENLIRSGREWYEPFPSGIPVTLRFSFPSLIPEERMMMRIRVAARSSRTSYFDVKAGEQSLGSVAVGPVNLYSFTSAYARAAANDYHFFFNEDELPVVLTYRNSDPANSRAWLDRITVQARCRLRFTGTPLYFRDRRSVLAGGITEFRITGEEGRIWDVTDLHHVREMKIRREDGYTVFRSATDVLREFVIFSGADFPTPETVEKGLPNQDLHGYPQATMVVVTHPDFLEEARTLAQYHHDHDQMDVVVATTVQVYNEFSSGARDVAAIRNFVRMFYRRAATMKERPRYLLLLGDGSYDNLSDVPGNPNFIPTYQSVSSLSPTQSYVTDDFFGLLDDTEGGVNGTLDIGVGRLPVTTPEEARAIVRKIEAYYTREAMGDWRNTLCFVGDDEDNNVHMSDANKLASYIDTTYPSFVIRKIYLDAYPQISTASGQRYPDVNQAITDNMERGILIFNYVGHGNERGLAHEAILGLNDIVTWHNFPRCPLFITATCEFSRFDDIEIDANGGITPRTSAGEQVLLSPDGGAIALLTTTRLVYSSPNFVLNSNFYRFVFEKNELGHPNTFGDALRYTKNSSGTSINKLNFTLLGDPALRLAYPLLRVITDSLNGVAVSSPHDTLKALSLITIAGHLETPDGIPLFYDGILYPTIFDKEREVTTLANDGGSPMTFTVRDNIIFKGKAAVNGGRFCFSFRVPKDISYKTGNGSISYYAVTDEGQEGAGSYRELVVGGFAEDPPPDHEGPLIRLFLNDTFFHDGGICDEDPVLLAYISDEGGINTVGNGIGHDLIAILDDDEQNPIVLNDHFSYDLNDYRKGSVRYPFFGLPEGIHTLRLKAWDNYNNSSEATLTFRVEPGGTGRLENLRNYPNPFREETRFTFDHNLGDQALDITIYIFDMGGHLVTTLEEHLFSGGYSLPPLVWNGRNSHGEKLPQGIYVYKVIVRSNDGRRITGSGKTVLIR